MSKEISLAEKAKRLEQSRNSLGQSGITGHIAREAEPSIIARVNAILDEGGSLEYEGALLGARYALDRRRRYIPADMRKRAAETLRNLVEDPATPNAVAVEAAELLDDIRRRKPSKKEADQ